MACLCHEQNVVQVNVYGTTLADMLRRGANIPMFLNSFGYDNCIVFDLPRGSGPQTSLNSTCPSEPNTFEDEIVKREPPPELDSQYSSPVKSTAGLELLNCTLSTIESDCEEEEDDRSVDAVSAEDETILSPWSIYENLANRSIIDSDHEFTNLSFTNSVADCLANLLNIVCNTTTTSAPAPQMEYLEEGTVADAPRTNSVHPFDDMDETMSPPVAAKQANGNYEHGQNSMSHSATENQMILRHSEITQNLVEKTADPPAPEEASGSSSQNDALTLLADRDPNVQPEPLDNSIERQRIADEKEEQSKRVLENDDGDEFFDCFMSEEPDWILESPPGGEQGEPKNDRGVCQEGGNEDDIVLLSTTATSDLTYVDASVPVKKRRRAAESEEKHYFCHFGTNRSCWKKLVWRGGYGLTRFMDHVKTHSSRPTLKCNYCDHMDRYDSKMRYHHKTKHAGLAWERPSSLENEEDTKELMELWTRCYPDLPLPRNCAVRRGQLRMPTS